MSSGQETDIFNCPTILYIKNLGLEKSDANLEHLIYLFHQDLGIDLKREIVSSIGRQTNSKKIYDFISQEVFNNHYMEVVYQMFRTVLYRSKSDMDFKNLKDNSKRNMLKFSLLFLAIGFGALYFDFSSRRLGWLFTDYWFSFPLRSGFLTMYFAYALRLFIEVIFDSKKENKQQAQISNQ